MLGGVVDHARDLESVWFKLLKVAEKIARLFCFFFYGGQPTNFARNIHMQADEFHKTVT